MEFNGLTPMPENQKKQGCTFSGFARMTQDPPPPCTHTHAHTCIHRTTHE